MNIIDVAQRAGVSTATVSRVLNGSNKVRESTAAAVRKVIAELDYVPNSSARGLRSGRSNLYGIIVSDIRNPFFPDLIGHFESLATQYGIDVTFVDTRYDEENLLGGIQRLLERNIDGLAIFTSEVTPRALKKLEGSSTPVVFLNQPTAVGSFRNIAVDYDRGFRDAVEHLCMLGHTRIGFVAGPPSLSSAVRRREAFHAAIQTCKLGFREEWMFQGDHRIAGGQFAARKIFSMRTPPSAVICSNDMTAVGLLQEANRLGRHIPEELSLIGFDDLYLCEIVQPALTTLHLSRQDIATHAFAALHRAEASDPHSRNGPILPRLIVRSSTGSAPESK